MKHQFKTETHAMYADNETIVNGGYFEKISSIRDTQWYQAFLASGRDIFSLYLLRSSETIFDNKRTGQTISIIRKLDHFYKKEIRKVLKIGIDYTALLKDILNESETRIFLFAMKITFYSAVQRAPLPFRNFFR